MLVLSLFVLPTYVSTAKVCECICFCEVLMVNFNVWFSFAHHHNICVLEIDVSMCFADRRRENKKKANLKIIQ